MDPPSTSTPSRRNTASLQQILTKLESKFDPFRRVKKYDDYDIYTDALIAEAQTLTPPESSSTYKSLMIEFEKWVLSKDISCRQPLSGLASAKTNVVSVKDAFMLTEGKRAYEPSIQRAMECFSDSIFEWGGDIPQAQRLVEIYNKWVVESVKLGGESVEGSVYKFSFDDNPLFAIKIPLKTSDKKTGLSHEAIIGIYALNPLKEIVPNFMHVYSSFTCSPPIVDENDPDRPIFALCPADVPGATTHLVVENIQGGDTALKWVRGNWQSPSDFLQVYLQVINALRVAYDFCRYTHYDLHHNNVMIQKVGGVDRHYVIPFYDRKGERKYIRTKYMARIIDYGFSHAEIEGVDFGTVLFDGQEDDYGIFTNSPFPLGDAYRILRACYVIWKREAMYFPKDPSIPVTISLFDALYSFFGTTAGNADKILGEPVGYLPYDHISAYLDPRTGKPVKCGEATHEMFLDHIFRQQIVIDMFSSFEAKADDIRVTDIDIDCSNSKCMKPSEIDNLLHGGMPTSLGQYNGVVADLIYSIPRTKNTEAKRRQEELVREYYDYKKFYYLVEKEYAQIKLLAKRGIALEAKISTMQKLDMRDPANYIAYLENLLLFKNYTRRFKECVENIESFFFFHKDEEDTLTESLVGNLEVFEQVLMDNKKFVKQGYIAFDKEASTSPNRGTKEFAKIIIRAVRLVEEVLELM